MKDDKEIRDKIASYRDQIGWLEDVAKAKDDRDVGQAVDIIRSLRSRIAALEWVMEGEGPISNDT